jgi:hypothetical protein
MSQLILSVVAILQTVGVHYLFKKDRAATAIHVDQVCHYTLPMLYVGVTAGMFMVANSEHSPSLYTGAMSLILVMSITLVPVTITLSWIRATSFDRQRSQNVKILQTLGIHSTHESEEAIRAVFESFDVDQSGD